MKTKKINKLKNEKKAFAFEMTTTYSHYYTIEAKDEKEAIKIHSKLLFNNDFNCYIDERAMKCWEPDTEYHYKGIDNEQFTHLSKNDIEDFLYSN